MTDWSCSFCSKIFVRKGDLNRHELLHTGIKPHVCGTCGKGFAQSCALKTHLNTHTGNKPYRCNAPGCKAAFGDPSSRTRHRKERHGKAQSHQCPVPGCNSSIKRTSTFKAHLRTHGLDPNTVLDPKKFPSTKRVPVMSPRPRKTSPELVQIPTLMPSNDSSISKSTLSPTNTPSLTSGGSSPSDHLELPVPRQSTSVMGYPAHASAPDSFKYTNTLGLYYSYPNHTFPPPFPSHRTTLGSWSPLQSQSRLLSPLPNDFEFNLQRSFYVPQPLTLQGRYSLKIEEDI